MFTSLMLLTAMCACQDAPPELAPAPEPEPPVAEAAEEPLPETTPENVRAFLAEAHGQLYDPLTAGLESLAFDLPIELPAPFGDVGTAHVTWSSGGEGQATMTVNDDLQLPPGVPITTEGLEAQGIQQGLQFLGNMLNRHVASLLESGVATMAGVQDGLVAVAYAAPDAANQGILSQVYLFDENSTLRRLDAAVKAPSPMGEMDVTMNQSFDWRAADAETGKLIIATQVVDTKMDTIMGLIEQKDEATYEYRNVGDIVLLVRVSTVRNMPAMMGGGQQTHVLAARNLVVNGTAAEEPVPEPPADTEEPAPAGG